MPGVWHTFHRYAVGSGNVWHRFDKYARGYGIGFIGMLGGLALRMPRVYNSIAWIFQVSGIMFYSVWGKQ